MRKLELSLENLEVESFATTKDDGAERGTVRGHDSGLGGCNTINCGDTPYFTNEGCMVDPSISADGQCICGDLLASGGQQTC